MRGRFRRPLIASLSRRFAPLLFKPEAVLPDMPRKTSPHTA